METPRGSRKWEGGAGGGRVLYPSQITKKSSCHDNNRSSSGRGSPSSQSRHIWLPTWELAKCDASFELLPVVSWLKTTSCMPLATCHMPPLAAAWKVVHPARMRSSGSQVSMETFFVAKFRWCHKMPQHAVARKQFLARFQRQRFAPKSKGHAERSQCLSLA